MSCGVAVDYTEGIVADFRSIGVCERQLWSLGWLASAPVNTYRAPFRIHLGMILGHVWQKRLIGGRLECHTAIWPWRCISSIIPSWRKVLDDIGLSRELAPDYPEPTDIRSLVGRVQVEEICT